MSEHCGGVPGAQNTRSDVAPLFFADTQRFDDPKTLEYFVRVVRAAAIEDDVLNFGTRLVGHALQNSLNELSLILGGG